MRSAVVALLLVAVPALAPAQSLNVDFGSGSAPSNSYAAVGRAGRWNVVGVLPPGQRATLLGLDGTPSPAKIYMIGGTALLDFDEPGTTGNDAALLDDMLIGFNDPIDVCIWIEGLVNGTYDVILYALTPDDPGLFSRTRVDFGSPGPTMVGGAWPGQHTPGVSYAIFSVTVTDGTIGLHSGLPSGFFQSGLNGLQIRTPTTTGAATLPLPSASGILGISPNPARGAQLIRLARASGAIGAGVEIFDAAGRLVWRRDLPGSTERVTDLLWDGRALGGASVAAGVYFVRFREGNAESATKLVRLDTP